MFRCSSLLFPYDLPRLVRTNAQKKIQRRKHLLNVPLSCIRPDDQSLVILKHTAASMKSGHSKVLINDIVLPDSGASRFATTSDINMLALLAAMERSEAQWRKLLETAGLQVIKIWQGNPESVIEAELAG